MGQISVAFPAIFAALTEGSLRHCRIKKWKETRSFPIRSPFDTYPPQTSKNQDFTICEMILCGVTLKIMGVTGINFNDYAITLHLVNQKVTKCILHMLDRNIDIEYLDIQQ